MKEINILILGIGGNVSQGILTAVRLSGIPCRIVGACISPNSTGLNLCDAAHVSPYAHEPNFIGWVVDICNQEKIDIILTGVEEIILALETSRTKWEKETDTIFISSDLKILKIGGDKLLTAQWLKDNGLNYPLSADNENSASIETLINQCGFPLFAKPKNGKGSRGIFKIKSRGDFDLVPAKDYCIQAYLGDDTREYTVGCYVDRTGIIQDLIVMRRKLENGTTVRAEIVQEELIRAECIRICAALKPKGPLNIQLRMHSGVPVCFELNVRFSGTAPMRAKLGYKDVEALIREYVYNDEIYTLLKPAKKGIAYRVGSEIVINPEPNNLAEDTSEIKDKNHATNNK